MVLCKRFKPNRSKFNIALILFLLFSINSFAEQVEVTADEVTADENKMISKLIGNVHIKKGSYDTLDANEVIIYFNKDRKPIKYVATGNARFKGILKDKHYDGRADIITYEPEKKYYTLSGNAHLHEVETKKEVYGDVITIDQINGAYNVNSTRSKNKNKKPARLIFQVEDRSK